MPVYSRLPISLYSCDGSVFCTLISFNNLSAFKRILSESLFDKSGEYSPNFIIEVISAISMLCSVGLFRALYEANIEDAHNSIFLQRIW